MNQSFSAPHPSEESLVLGSISLVITKIDNPGSYNGASLQFVYARLYRFRTKLTGASRINPCLSMIPREVHYQNETL
jgi:hypothetical protein